MPIEQDPTSNSTSPSIKIHHNAANTNPEEFSAHMEPSLSNRAISPCLEDLEPFHQQSVPPQFSTLHGSLRPIILKVFSFVLVLIICIHIYIHMCTSVENNCVNPL